MAFWGKLGRGLKATGRVIKPALPIAKIILASTNPAIALGLGLVTHMVDAESTFPESGSGLMKADYVRGRIAKMLPEVLRTAEAVMGRDMVDEAAVADALDDLLEAQFRLLTLTGVLNKEGNV